MRHAIWLGLLLAVGGCSGCGGLPPSNAPRCQPGHAAAALLVAPFALPVAIVENMSN